MEIWKVEITLQKTACSFVLENISLKIIGIIVIKKSLIVSSCAMEKMGREQFLSCNFSNFFSGLANH